MSLTNLTRAYLSDVAMLAADALYEAARLLAPPRGPEPSLADDAVGGSLPTEEDGELDAEAFGDSLGPYGAVVGPEAAAMLANGPATPRAPVAKDPPLAGSFEARFPHAAGGRRA